jgi:hypothetical protein
MVYCLKKVLLVCRLGDKEYSRARKQGSVREHDVLIRRPSVLSNIAGLARYLQ